MKNMTTNTLHTCSYECDHPEHVRAQRDYLRDRLEALTAVQQPAADQFIVTFRCETNGVVGTTTAKIHSVSRHDDGVIEVVIDHWPEQPPAGDGCHCGTCTCNPNMTPAVRYDLSPAQQEGAIREHLIRLGWTPPEGGAS